MLGLPKGTELNKQLPKKAIYAKFHMNTLEKEKIDADISKITIVNEISPKRVNIEEGKHVKSFFVILVSLKNKNFDEKNIITISKLIPQNMLFILEYGEESKLAVYHKKLMQTKWLKKDSFFIKMKGLNLDTVWENIILQVSEIEIEQGNTIDEQIEVNDKRQKFQKEINRLEKKARSEKQPKKKFDIVQKINKLKREFEEI